MAVDDKKNKKMAEAKRVEMYPHQKKVDSGNQKDDVIEDLFNDLKEIDNLLNDHQSD